MTDPTTTSRAAIRGFRAGDGPQLVEAWCRSAPADPITPDRFRSLVLLDANFDPLLDRVAQELEASRTARGPKRAALVERLAQLDRELIEHARAALDNTVLTALAKEADDELAEFRARITPDAYARARDAAVNRLIREQTRLPALAFS